MKVKRAVLAGLGLAACSAVVMAADQSIDLTANVPKFCKFDGVPSFTNLDNVTIGSIGINTSVVNVTVATNSLGIMNEAGFKVTIPATCNHPSTIVFTSVSGALKDPSPEPISSGTFLNQIGYTVSGTWDNAGVANLVADGTPNKSSTPKSAATAHTGDLEATVSLSHNATAPLAAGDYTDTLRISLTPQ